jgi:hypothetical protein
VVPRPPCLSIEPVPERVFGPSTEECVFRFLRKRFFAVDDDRCSECGASLALIGRRHRCVPNSASTVPNTVPNKLKTGDAQRVAKWKAANKEKDRAYHRELMRKRRAAGK